ncbi:MAG: Uma2 family endonuclease [Thiotrichaceae bacterium]|nr:Uma2 family endonuclease [Thiotrichaceae bacterium]
MTRPKQVFNPLKDEIKTQALPLLAIEILSPNQNLQELLDKCSLYFASGVKSCWLVVACAVMVMENPDTAITYVDKMNDENLEISLNLKEVFS